MDRSFLTQTEVIDAARRFVCVRLATYENAEEAKMLTSLFTGHSGQMENTLFTILAPDGKRVLVRAGRSTKHAFADAAEMAKTMTRVAAEFDAKAAAQAGTPDLPKTAGVRLALDIAACDLLPLVVLFAKDAPTLSGLEDRVRKAAWSDPFVGQFIYAVTADAAELKAIEGVPAEGGLLVIEPDEFGLQGRVIASAKASASDEEIARALQAGLSKHQPSSLAFGEHIREGRRRNLFWDTKIPVTDPEERQVRERGR